MDSTIVENTGKSISWFIEYKEIIGPIVAAFCGAFFAFLFSIFNGYRKRYISEKEELIALLKAIKSQNEINKEGFQEAIRTFEAKMYPTSRSVVNAVENNTYLLALRLKKDDKCLESIFKAYEKQVHLNRRWDYIHESEKANHQGEINNCNTAIKLIDEANSKISSYIKDQT